MEILILFRFLTNGNLLHYLSLVFNELMWLQPVDNWLERNNTTFSFQQEDIFKAQFVEIFILPEKFLTHFPKKVFLFFAVDCYNKVEKTFGMVSLVGNVAGILTEENWSKMIDVNLVS